jgi:HPr kinase/phosphorylase
MSRFSTIHASAVLLGETGVLIRGASGSGKSTLLLALIAADPQGAHLVADDRVAVAAVNARLIANVPDPIAGLVEMRGLGLLTRSWVAPIVIRFIVDLIPLGDCVRMPDADSAQAELEGVILPRYCLPIGCSDGVQRVHFAMKNLFNPKR